MPKHKRDKHPNKGASATPQAGQAPENTAAGADLSEEKGDNKAFQEHDTANRLGSFEVRGNHARTGNRGHQ